MRPFRRLLNGYGMVVSTTSLVKRFINLHPFRFVLMIYAFNYIINIYCLRMGDIGGTFLPHASHSFLTHPTFSSFVAALLTHAPRLTPVPPSVVSKIGQKTTSATNVEITTQPM
jgi:hypothetical protein